MLSRLGLAPAPVPIGRHVEVALARAPLFIARAELGYIFGRFAWGRGVATEAARACLRFGFERLGCDVIGAGALKANAGSLRILEKLGMRPTPNAHYDDHGGAYFAIARAERGCRGAQ